MAIRRFRTSRLIGNVIQLEFDMHRGHPLSVTIPLENANQLTAGLLDALRSAEQHGYQIPPITPGRGQAISINDLPVDRSQVTVSPDAPGRVFLHLVAAGGLSLTYSFEPDEARRAGEALAATA